MNWSRGVILVMDALGIKGVWARVSPEKVVASWQSVIDVTEHGIKRLDRLLSVAGVMEKAVLKNTVSELYDGYFLQVFSDTLILALRGRSELVVPAASFAALFPFLRGLAEGIYFRGVISIGEFYGSKKGKLIIGPAVDEAVEWYMKPDWIGVSTAPSAFFELERLTVGNALPKARSHLFVRWAVPTRDQSKVEGWVVDWPAVRGDICKIIAGNTDEVTEEYLLSVFSSRPIGSAALSKYMNTLEFFRSRKAAHQQTEGPK